MEKLIKDAASDLKTCFRQVALNNWKNIGEIEDKIKQLDQQLTKMGCSEDAKQPFEEIKEGVLEYKKALDNVIAKFS